MNEDEIYEQIDQINKEDKSQAEKYQPSITYQAKILPDIVSAAEQCLILSGEHIYQRDGKLIRIGRFPTKDGKPDLRFVEIKTESMIETLTSIISWTKMSKDKEQAIACPPNVAATLMARSGQWELPVLVSVITAPTLRSDGSLLEQEGYDSKTGLYLDPQGVEFPKIADQPTKDQARHCLDKLIATVSEVPFVVDEIYGAINRSVFLSAVLSALIRPILPAVPLHGFDAPAPGSGKSILVDCISYLLTGNPASPLTQGGEEETTKTLSSALQAGMQVISFDNCEFPLGGAMLCQAITQPRLSVRVFGKTELRDITNTGMYLATGNNLLLTGDIVRRAMRSRVDAQCERPEERKFTTQRPDLYMRDNRVEVVMAGLWVLRAFFTAGCPQQCEPVGNFENWSKIVRDCLIWLGEPDPWLTTSLIRQDDPKSEADTALFNAWWEAFHDNMMTTKDVIETIGQKTEPMGGQPGKFRFNALRDAIISVTNNDLTSQAIGTWLRNIKDRPIGGFMVVKGTVSHGNNRWQLTKTDDLKNEPVFT